jgi:hypothetical protein
MTRPHFNEHDLEAEFVFARRIGRGRDLDSLQIVLAELAPNWCTKLRVWRGPRDQRTIDLSEQNALRAAVLGAIGERGEVYAEMVARHGAGAFERAVGRDFGRALPGLFWLNFFGETYCNLFGVDRLKKASGHRGESVDGGWLVEVTDDPGARESANYRSLERKVLAQLGEDVFFSKADPERVTRAPEWPLPEIAGRVGGVPGDG